jgi:hypothetical protein
VKIKWRKMQRLYPLTYRDLWTCVVVLWRVSWKLALMHILWHLVVSELEITLNPVKNYVGI